MSKKLIALNMAIIILIVLPLNFVFAEDNVNIFEYSTDVENILKIDGNEYDANQNASGIGWEYYPNFNYSSQRPHINAYLTIHENYSGLPITVPKNVYIGINGNIKGDESTPAITVYGDVDISLFNHAYESLNNLELIGHKEHPAIKATGEVYLGGITDDNDSCLIQGGGRDTPAIVASKISFYNAFFYSGADIDKLNVTNSYIDAHILKLIPEGNHYSITVSNGDVAPPTPQHNNYIFVGWKVTEGQGFIHPNNVLNWYMPGDVVDIESDNIILQASYLNDNRTSVAIALHGNGGVTEENSKYYITLASTHRLSLYDISQKSFVRDGYKFNGYNSTPSGDGTNYTYDDHLNDDGSSFVYNLYAQWERIEPYVESKVKVKGTSHEVISNFHNIDGDAVVIAAGYKEKCLVDIKYNSQGLSNVLEGEIDEIKIMVWDSMNGLKPLCDVESIFKNEFVVE